MGAPDQDLSSAVTQPAMERKLRHLTLIDRVGSFGGAERLAVEISKRLPHERFERSLCATRWGPELQSRPSRARALDDLSEHGVRFVGLNRKHTLDLRSWRRLLAFMRGERIDILHAHKFGSNLWAALLGPRAGVPVIVAHEHTWSFEGGARRRFIDRRVIARRCDIVVAVSREDRRRLVELEGIPPERVLYIPNGIPAPPPPAGAVQRQDLGLRQDDLVVGTVAVLRPQKALDVLVRAAAIVRTEFPRLRVLVVGAGPEYEVLEELIEELDLSTTVSLLGYRTDVPELLPIFDLAASSSEFEGSPLAVLEYMEAGLPVVSTRVGGIPDLVEDGVTGLLVDRGDPGALAGAIAELLRDPERRAQMGRLARERRRSEFDIDVTVERIEQLYEDLYRDKARAG
jgi:glycosyltransferase involved in cell wall biosynthesis